MKRHRRYLLATAVSTVTVVAVINEIVATAGSSHADAAESSSAGGCPVGPNSCCEVFPFGGCNDETCCNIVCGIDPSCCDDVWDDLCVNLAIAECDICGACCGQAGACTITDATQCANQNADFQGAGTVCNADTCPLGACCYGDVCVLDSPNACDLGGGVYFGNDTGCFAGICEPPCPPNGGDCCQFNFVPGCNDPDCCNAVCAVNPFCCVVQWDEECAEMAGFLCQDICCPPLGACCLQDGSCVEVTQTECSGDLGGDFQGTGTACADGPCGACCSGVDFCRMSQQEFCNVGNEVWQGPATICGTNCGFSQGACCRPFHCFLTTSAVDCTNFGGLYQGDNTTCAECFTGACCVGNCICEQTNAEVCENVGGVYAGDDTICGAGICDEGACCFNDQACFEMTQFECAFFGGEFLGEIPCTGSGCAEGVGACCVDGCCLELTRDECEPLEGSFQGGGTTCDGFSCAEGACVLPGQGVCVTITSHLCGIAGGVYQGDGTQCVRGACCIGGSCDETTELECTLLCGGTYQGDGSKCDFNTDICGSGACCLPDGDCQVMTEWICALFGGVYQGDDMPCGMVPCVTGACCFEEGICIQRTQDGCEAAGGDYLGDLTDCDLDPCDAPTGACCFGDGLCDELKEFFCVAFGGAYEGDGITCASEPCPAGPGACCMPDDSCMLLTQLQCETNGGEYQGPGTDCNNVVCGPGACCLLSGLCIEASESFCITIGGDFGGQGTICAGTTCTSFVLSEPTEFVVSGEATVGIARSPGPATDFATESDLDGDGTPDLVVVIPSENTAQVLLNQGNNAMDEWLGFLALGPFTTGTNPSGVDVGQLNNTSDTFVDVVVSNAGDNQVVVFFGAGDASFSSSSTINVGTQPSDVISRDLFPIGGPDGSSDLAVANELDNSVTFISSDGSGGFTQEHVVDTGGFNPVRILAGEATEDKDDCLDVIGINRNFVLNTPGPMPPGNVFVLKVNSGTGLYELVGTTDVGTNPKDLAVGDLDGDGTADVAVANADDESISILISNGDGTFVRTDIPDVGFDPRSIDAADVDGDGDRDLAVVADMDVVKVLYNITPMGGPVAFGEPIPMLVDDNPNFMANPNFVVNADLDVDGITDLITMNQDAMTSTGGSVSALIRAACENDVDGDGMVGMSDLMAVLGSWGACGDPCPEDVNDDGLVGIDDFLLVLGHWGTCP